MPVPPFIAELRELIGHRPLWIAIARAVVLDDDGRVLVGRDASNGGWALPGGTIEPGEQPADAAVRECYEETGVVAVPDMLTSVTVSPPEVHPNGDQTQHVELTFRCHAVDGKPRPGDGELLDARWYRPEELPQVEQRTNDLALIRLALKSEGVAAFHFSGVTQLVRHQSPADPPIRGSSASTPA